MGREGMRGMNGCRGSSLANAEVWISLRLLAWHGAVHRFLAPTLELESLSTPLWSGLFVFHIVCPLHIPSFCIVLIVLAPDHFLAHPFILAAFSFAVLFSLRSLHHSDFACCIICRYHIPSRSCTHLITCNIFIPFTISLRPPTTFIFPSHSHSLISLSLHLVLIIDIPHDCIPLTSHIDMHHT